ncbi:uncharacterized protein LOC111101485 [Crassostrea virginica]
MLPIPKHSSHGFSIESIINTSKCETVRENSPVSRTEPDGLRTSLGTRCEHSAITGRIPPLHPSLPLHVRNLLFAGEQTGTLPVDLLRYGQSPWSLHANSPLPSISSLSRSVPQYTDPLLSPEFTGLWPRISDQMTLMNPWLMTRGPHSLIGLPVGQPGPGLFFQPYRKPKRIRTAFSPSQLLKLENAFEKNHYVVGQERKDLATKLNLSETQVKVWFQNRRTKFKRVKTDDELEQEDQPTGSNDGCEENLNVTEHTDDDSEDGEHC